MTRRDARQLVSHAHFTVNGKKVNIPSYLVKAGDVIEVAEAAASAKFQAAGPRLPCCSARMAGAARRISEGHCH